MEFGPQKCYRIHVGECISKCPKIKVHEHEIKNVEQFTYLGDIITGNISDTKNKNIENRRGQGIAPTSQIFSLLDQLSLGYYYFEMALIMRDSILISKLVFNIEVWLNMNIKNESFTKLQQIDEMYLRQLFNVISVLSLGNVFT